jgi:2-desacetyl-2-hydroxyethyl bacteriochlorophyllide A dehydrogenase
MKQATMTAPGQIAFGEAEKPAPGPGEVLLHIRRIGVCGSDIHVWHGRHPFTKYPVVQGHEFSATVAATGPGVTGIPAGAKVTAQPQMTCGKCRACLRGDYHICSDLRVWGFQTNGVAQDYFVAPAASVLLLPDSFTFEQGAFIEPCSVAVHATSRPWDLTGRNVVVIGAGTIGNLVAQAARTRGGRVMIADVSAHRLGIAKQCGLDASWNPGVESLDDAVRRVFGADGWFDTAFECAGAEGPLNDVLRLIEKGGTIVQVGLYGQMPRAHLSLVSEHELRILGSLMYRRPDYEQAVRWVADGSIVLAPLESRHFAFADFAEAYRFIEREGDRSMKVFVDVND